MKNSHTFNTFIVTLGRSFERIVLLISTIILSRYLTQTDYGTYRQVILITGLMITIFSFGIPQSINYFLPQFSRDTQKSFIIQTMIFQIALGVLSAIIIWFGAGFISASFQNVAFKGFLRFMVLYPIFLLPVSSYSNIFICIDKAKLSGILSSILGVIKLILILIPVFLKLSVYYIFFAINIFVIVQFVLIIFIIFRLFTKINVKFSYEIFIKQIKFALPIGFASILGILIVKIDQLMISSYFSTEEYATYSIGSLEIPFVNILTVSAMAVLTPFFVKQFKDQRIDLFIKKWQNSLLKISYIIFPVSIFFIFFAEETMVFLYSDKYLLSAMIFRIYVFRLFVKITFFGHILLALGRSKIIFIYTLITLITNIVLNFVSIKLFGFIGPAIATVIASYIISFLQLMKISKILTIKFSQIWPWRKLFFILLISFLCGLMTSWLRYLKLNEGILLVLEGLIFISLFLFLTQYLLKKYFLLPITINSLIQRIKNKSIL